jgi:hypothetical protein
MRVLPILLVMVAVLATAACYRVSAPPALGEPVRVTVVHNASRLPAIQVDVHRAVSDRLVRRLGWTVAGNGTARLDIELDEERIRPDGADSRGVTTRWTVRIEGTAMLASQRGNVIHRFGGSGWYGSLADEPTGLRNAANAAAEDLANWLEATATTWPPQ